MKYSLGSAEGDTTEDSGGDPALPGCRYGNESSAGWRPWRPAGGRLPCGRSARAAGPPAPEFSRWPSCSTSKMPRSGTATRCSSTRLGHDHRRRQGGLHRPQRRRQEHAPAGDPRRGGTRLRRDRPPPRLRLGYLRQHDPFLPGETALDFLMRDSGQPDWKCGEVAGQFELKGSGSPGRCGTLGGLADPREARRPAPPRAESAPARRTDQLPRPAHADPARALPPRLPRSLPDRVARPGVPRATCDQTLDLSGGKLTMFPGKVDAFLDYQREKAEHVERTNAAVLSKRRQLEDFIARNKARASTASRAKSKSKQLEKLEVEEVATAPRPRRSAARPCRPARDRPCAAADSRSAIPTEDRRRGRRRRDRARLPGRDRRRQRPGQDDVPADARRLAHAASPAR
jgi:hypothetical protein